MHTSLLYVSQHMLVKLPIKPYTVNTPKKNEEEKKSNKKIPSQLWRLDKHPAKQLFQLNFSVMPTLNILHRISNYFKA